MNQNKNIMIITAFAVMTFTSCTKQEMDSPGASSTQELPGDRVCASMEVLDRQLQEDPSLRTRMEEIEKFTENYVQNYRLLPDGTIEIPVVFNVLYKTTAQNVSLSQLQSQITVLNADFAATNSDYNNTPAGFQSARSGNIGITFVLDAVNRKATNKSSWSTNDAMKKTNQGGISPTSTSTKLNIWVCNMGGGILGYAQFPGGNANTDGVVLDDNATGNNGTAQSPYGLGRTATHEIGHWLNLRHIWGDANCGSDLVSDTPTHNTANYGCPNYPHLSTCSGTPIEMTMNYMDYTYDACMYMFTQGQKTRMKAVFAVGGSRHSFAL